MKMVAGESAPEAGPRPPGAVPAPELRDALERTLEELNADDSRGPLLRATGLRVRLRLTDVGLVLDIAASDSPDRYLRWSFGGEVDWEPKFELEMDSEVANAYLQGSESLAIAVARRRARCRCDWRAMLRFLPAAKLIAEPYKRIVASEYPHLALE
jgi:hypothetical protein